MTFLTKFWADFFLIHFVSSVKAAKKSVGVDIKSHKFTFAPINSSNLNQVFHSEPRLTTNEYFNTVGLLASF